MAAILYPDEKPMVYRKSSIDQFGGFFSIMKKGGWAPIVFDQLDSVRECGGVNAHPVIISWSDDVGYIFPETQCTYASDHFIYVDKEGIEQKILPECMGGKGEFYEFYSKSFSFINFDGPDGGSSVGVHETKTLRTGLSYVLADNNLPPVA